MAVGLVVGKDLQPALVVPVATVELDALFEIVVLVATVELSTLPDDG